MKRTTFSIPRMDCAAEERMVRVALEGRPGIEGMEPDLVARRLAVYHRGEPESVLAALQPLGLGTRLLASEDVQALPPALSAPSMPDERRTLQIALAINAVMFVAELGGGYLAESTALIADSLDMFADAAVYGIALYGVSGGLAGQATAARASGWLQLALAIGAAFEVTRRALGGSEPEAAMMMAMAVVALLANAATMKLLAGHREAGAHMKASWIFTTNDVLANAGVILSGLLVRATEARWPDLVVGSIIAALVLRGALRILRVAASAQPQSGQASMTGRSRYRPDLTTALFGLMAFIVALVLALAIWSPHGGL